MQYKPTVQGGPTGTIPAIDYDGDTSLCFATSHFDMSIWCSVFCLKVT